MIHRPLPLWMIRLGYVFRLERERARMLVHPPHSFNDKVHWRMLYDRRELLRVACDKVAVREYVAALAGDRYLIPVLGVFGSAAEIRWSGLEVPCVLKPSHGSGWVIVIRDKDDIDPDVLRTSIDRWLGTDYSRYAREWPYRGLPRKVIVERFIGPDEGMPENYKFYCFHGEPRAIHVDYDSGTPRASRTFLDPSWQPLPFKSGMLPPGPTTGPPPRLTEMLELARAVSKEFDFVRVDLYATGDRVYFGELTPTPAAGYYKLTGNGSDWLGSLWSLPPRNGRRYLRRVVV